MSPSFAHDPMGVLVPERDLDWLRTRLASLRPAVAVEIGSWAGSTTRVIAEYAGRVYAIDHWRGNGHEPDWPVYIEPLDAFRTFARNLGEAFLTTVIPCTGYSRFWASLWPASLGIDFLFIDGDHRYEAVSLDLAAWLPHVKPGGLIAGHDYDRPDVQRAVAEVFPGDCFQSGTCCIWAACKRPVVLT